MNHREESPKNLRKTNPYNIEKNDDVKMRHYYAKYNSCKERKEFPETSAFSLGEKIVNDFGEEKYVFNDCDLKLKQQLKLKNAIKSLLIPSKY